MANNPPSRLDGPGSRPWKSDTCWDCIHIGAGRTCAAFPEGIPDDLWSADHGHRVPYPGDNGIQYQQMPMPTAPVEIPEFLRKKAP